MAEASEPLPLPGAERLSSQEFVVPAASHNEGAVDPAREVRVTGLSFDEA